MPNRMHSSSTGGSPARNHTHVARSRLHTFGGYLTKRRGGRKEYRSYRPYSVRMPTPVSNSPRVCSSRPNSLEIDVIYCVGEIRGRLTTDRRESRTSHGA